PSVPPSVAIEAYDPEADTKYVASLHALRDLKYPMLDQVKSLKDALIDVIMSSLHLVSDSGEDAPQWIRELRPSSSQLKIHVYPKMCDLKDPCSFKEEILSKDVVAANVSRAEKKKKSRVPEEWTLAETAGHCSLEVCKVSMEVFELLDKLCVLGLRGFFHIGLGLQQRLKVLYLILPSLNTLIPSGYLSYGFL
nr:hypothetical protein [Tanacetum cinerariifolium]